MTFDDVLSTTFQAITGLNQISATATLTSADGAHTGTITIAQGDPASNIGTRDPGEITTNDLLVTLSRAAAILILGREITEQDTLTIGTIRYSIIGLSLDPACANLTLANDTQISALTNGNKIARP